MGFWVRSKLIGSLSLKQKAAKENPGRWHDRVAGGMGRAKLLTWGRHIFVLNLNKIDSNNIF